MSSHNNKKPKGDNQNEKILAIILVAVMMLCVSAAAFADAFISLDQAKQIALDFVGVSACEATFTKACQDWENGGRVYEIEFWVGSTEYEMDVNAQNGMVTDFNVEYHGGYYSQPVPAPIPQPIQNYWGDDWDDLYDHDWDDLFDWD